MHQGAFISAKGAVRAPSELSTLGWWWDGALIDMEGHLVAALEFASLEGLPNALMPSPLYRSETVDDDGLDPDDWDPNLPIPEHVGSWRIVDLHEFLRGGLS